MNQTLMNENSTQNGQTQKGSSPKKNSALGWMVKLLGGLAILAVLLVGAAWAFVSYGLPGMIQNTLADKTGFGVSSRAFKIDALKGRVELTDLLIMNPQQFGAGAFLSMPSLVVQADLGTVMSQNIHIKELSMHVAEVAGVINSDGQKNFEVFARGLQNATAAQQTAQSNTASAQGKKVSIGRLALRVDKVNFVNNAVKPSQNFSLPLGLNIERLNVTDVTTLQNDITSAALKAGGSNLGPLAVQMISGTALSGLFQAGALGQAGTKQITAITEQLTGQATQQASQAASAVTERFQNSLGEAGQATEKVTKAAENLKSIFQGFGR